MRVQRIRVESRMIFRAFPSSTWQHDDSNQVMTSSTAGAVDDPRMPMLMDGGTGYIWGDDARKRSPAACCYWRDEE